MAIKQEYEQAYPRAIYIDEADPTYNCHAYAWHISEGGSHVWMGMSTNPTSIYWEDGSYIETTASDPEATKVSYPDDNHSAIVSTPSYYFISKWGNTCLFKHTKSDCPYQRSKTLRYFKLSMKISGKQVLVIPPSGNTVTSEYILSRVPVGASVEWVVDRGAATIVSGQGSIVLLGLVKLGLDPALCLISASLGNTAGGMTCYYMGRLGRVDWIEKYFKVKKEKIDKMQRFLRGKGALMAFFAFLPAIGEVISMALGFMRSNVWLTTASMFAGKLIRYIILLKAMQEALNLVM